MKMNSYVRKERLRDEPPQDRLSIFESFDQSSDGGSIWLRASFMSR